MRTSPKVVRNGHARGPYGIQLVMKVMRRALPAWMALGFLAMPAGAAGGPGDGDDALVKAFEKLGAAQQKRALAAVREAVGSIDDPHLRALRALAAEGTPAPATAAAPKRSKPASGIAPPGAAPFPIRVEYLFGERRIRAVDEPSRAVKPADELRALLAGHPVDADRALAALLARLDGDRAADEFARFLESWRNGDESFYRALDRAAGTPEEVFFFDAMLGDFTAKFVRGKAAKGTAPKTLQQAHDALHDGFLAYRQYRGVREAAALAVCLKPDAAFPANLARYAQAPAGSYSLRDEVEILLASGGQDPAAAIELIVSSARPLPQPLWSAPYDALAPFHQAFRARAVSTSGAHTDDLLKGQRAARAAASAKVSEAAREALASALKKGPAEAGIGR